MKGKQDAQHLRQTEGSDELRGSRALKAGQERGKVSALLHDEGSNDYFLEIAGSSEVNGSSTTIASTTTFLVPFDTVVLIKNGTVYLADEDDRSDERHQAE